jgi:predicted CoA-substrate-specific enzyme activase
VKIKQPIISIGIDSGSRLTKAVLFDLKKNAILDQLIEDSEPNHETQIDRIISEMLSKNNFKSLDIKGVFCTGYGRKNYTKATKNSSEIICHAKGVYYLDPTVRTIIDIGGQDSKIIRLDETGKVINFVMNDKCAAGTGRFLEKVTQILKLNFNELNNLYFNSDKTIEISSTCVVFAESEIIGLISLGESKENIINAVYYSIAHRLTAMAGGLKLTPPIAFVGGIATIKGIVVALEKCLGYGIIVPNYPIISGALGASLIVESNM